MANEQLRLKNKIKPIIKKLKMSQRQIAQRIGCDQSQFNRYINEKQEPGIIMSLLICKELGKPVEEVFCLRA
ncbi:MAG: helix-turn-helix domain-containing protein [Pseudobdellovibrionaceae bacterium]